MKIPDAMGPNKTVLIIYCEVHLNIIVMRLPGAAPGRGGVEWVDFHPPPPSYT